MLKLFLQQGNPAFIQTLQQLYDTLTEVLCNVLLIKGHLLIQFIKLCNAAVTGDINGRCCI